MKYYDFLGYSDLDGDQPLTIKYPLFYKEDIISFEDRFVFPSNGACKAYAKNTGTKYDPSQYQIIPFSDFAKEYDIKLPLLTSEDVVNLYEGDLFWGVFFNPSLKTWHISNYNIEYGPFVLNNIDCEDGEDFPYVSSSSTNKAFSSEKSALDWIEAQKPKDIIINATSGYPIIVYAKPFLGNEYIHLDMSKRGDYNGANLCFTIKELREVITAYESLHDVG